MPRMLIHVPSEKFTREVVFAGTVFRDPWETYNIIPVGARDKLNRNGQATALPKNESAIVCGWGGGPVVYIQR